MAVFGLLSLQVLMQRQFARESGQHQHGVGCQGKPCGCDCPSNLWKILFSNFSTLKTIENFANVHLSGKLNIMRNSRGLKTGLSQDA